MGKKAGIITTISIIGIAINASNKKNDSTPTQPTPIEPTNITFTNISINNLKNSLISIVDNEQLTREEFNSNLLENIKRNFSVDNKNIDNLISKVEFNNQNILDITFNKINTKYSLDTNFDKMLASLSNNVLSIPLNISSNFYTAIPISNLNNLQSAIISYISQSANHFTTTEFSAQLNSTSFKKVIADAINTTQDSVGSISYSGTTLTIAPNSSTNSKVKFSSTQSSSILVNGSLQLSIPSSNFYTAILVSNFYTVILVDNSAIINLRNEINNYLASNTMVTKNDVNSYLMNEMYSFFQNTKISNDKNLLDYVYSPTYSDNSITLKLKTNIGKYKFVQSSSNEILIKNNEIIFNNLQLSTIDTPQESPENWFIWDNSGTQITGLSSIGLSQSHFNY